MIKIFSRIFSQLRRQWWKSFPSMSRLWTGRMWLLHAMRLDRRYQTQLGFSMVKQRISFQFFSHNHKFWILLTDVETLETSAKYQILPNGDLVVSNIREEDMGCYKCIRENESGAVSGEAFLIVLIRTHITQPPVDTTALLGSVATLQCKVSSDRNVEFNISWIKDK